MALADIYSHGWWLRSRAFKSHVITLNESVTDRSQFSTRRLKRNKILSSSKKCMLYYYLPRVGSWVVVFCAWVMDASRLYTTDRNHTKQPPTHTRCVGSALFWEFVFEDDHDSSFSPIEFRRNMHFSAFWKIVGKYFLVGMNSLGTLKRVYWECLYANSCSWCSLEATHFYFSWVAGWNLVALFLLIWLLF